MNGTILEVIVVGAGHAGLSLSYYLKHLGLEHMVFERGRIGESWRSQRWNSLTFNTVNRLNALPGSSHKIKDPEKFGTASEFVYKLEMYVSGFQLPVSENTNVLSIEKPEGSPYFLVTVSHDNEAPRTFNSWQVVIASGSLNQKIIPSFAPYISPDVQQIHSSEYQNPEQFQDGAVLVVGSGQSGCQIAEELLEAGKTVFLATSKVPRLPRRYRGKDIMDWLLDIKYFDVKTSTVSDPEMIMMKEPLLSGIGDGHTISLQYLAGKGAILTGRMSDARDNEVFFADNLQEHLIFGDEFSNSVKEMIDAYIRKMQQQTPDPEVDEADLWGMEQDLIPKISSLNFTEKNIRSIVWATGLNGNFDYIKLPVLGRDRLPSHENGITAVEGLYFLGLPWLRSRKSNLIYGVKEDAGFISNKVYSALR